MARTPKRDSWHPLDGAGDLRPIWRTAAWIAAACLIGFALGALL